MSFLTERFFQVLDSHRLYQLVGDAQSLRYFLERHVICVWGYNALLKSLQRDLVNRSRPLNSEPVKEALRLINEIVLDEQVCEHADGRIVSHLEIYLDGMAHLNCDLFQIFGFFDLLETGVEPLKALHSMDFPEEVRSYGEFIVESLSLPLHQKCTVLFYEGEPYIPDSFLNEIDAISRVANVDCVIEYLENHIEGLKKPGFSSAGRLVEILCQGDQDLNREAEKAAEMAMSRRIDLWNAVAGQLDREPKSPRIFAPSPAKLKLVTP